jgi:hypothetical protein
VTTRRVGAHDRERRVLDQGQLLPHDPGDRAESGQVAGADIGDDRGGGLDDGPEPGDFSNQAGAGFDDQRLGVVRRGENGQRDPDQIVVVGPGGPRPEPGPQHRGDHLLGARLAIAAGDPDDRTADFPAPRPRQSAQRLQGVVHRVEHQAGHR